MFATLQGHPGIPGYPGLDGVEGTKVTSQMEILKHCHRKYICMNKCHCFSQTYGSEWMLKIAARAARCLEMEWKMTVQ